MIDLLKKALALLLKLAEWLPAVRRAHERRALRKAIAEHDREALNRILQKMRDKKR